MEFAIQDWHWLVFGMLLVVAEIFIPSFTIFWFGLGAMIVAGCLWLLPEMSPSWQLFIWAVSSSVFTLLWFKYFRPLMTDRTKAGISREAIIGESGQVIKSPKAGGHGTVRFSMPLLGADEWLFRCDDPVTIGDRVFVKDISGNTLLVSKNKD
ncbi:MAG: NfeD family protein [Gammaproteobacteria bacterium]|nr:NfeD family protein [Gammaproteobacteria bacterium]